MPLNVNSLRPRKEQLYIYTCCNDKHINKIGTGIFSFQFRYSLRFNNSIFSSSCSLSEKYALHQLASILYLLEKKQEFFRNKDVYFYTNLPKPPSPRDIDNTFLYTLLLNKQKLNCSLSFVNANENQLTCAKSAAQFAIQSHFLHGQSSYITLHNHHTLSVTSLKYE
jgi:hypothetical protein